METSVRELKAHLSEYLRRVAEGEEVTVKVRGKPVARLTPILSPKPEQLENEAVARLDALPWIKAEKRGAVRGSDRPIAWPEDQKPLSEIVAEERE
ncbi:type II toxin-antitoxin system Phd/YefM family antitoxin [Methylohalobius crimeensis]|uniref:type II toxin-antitoxin system Phd/YefM family antitoxin n=1 Tax=Methylohalobius crimeensis TaxID=244365 RepID=UPI0003B443FB|nr:type II toxin-antitoxin system prevent-host-death family antitoxin [Methylohalobius crimeensis]